MNQMARDLQTGKCSVHVHPLLVELNVHSSSIEVGFKLIIK